MDEGPELSRGDSQKQQGAPPEHPDETWWARENMVGMARIELATSPV